MAKSSHDGADVALSLIGVVLLFQSIKILVQKACYGRLAIDIDDSKCIARHGDSVRMGSASRPLSHCAVDKSREGRTNQYIRQKCKQRLSVDEAAKTGRRWMELSRRDGSKGRELRACRRGRWSVGRGVYATQFGQECRKSQGVVTGDPRWCFGSWL